MSTTAGRGVGAWRRSQVLHMIGNAHIDPVWLWQWQEGYQEVRATFRSALDRMREYPEFIFTASSARYYAWVEEIDPAMFDEIRARVAEGRWEIVGGWWIQPDCNIPSRRVVRAPGALRAALLPGRARRDGHGGLQRRPLRPQRHAAPAARRAGMDSYVFMRPGPHEKGLPGPLFWWESPDGSRVLAIRIPYEYCSPARGPRLPPRQVARPAARPVRRDDGVLRRRQPRRRADPREPRVDPARSTRRARCPSCVHSTPERVLRPVRERGTDDVPVVHDDLQHHAVGCYCGALGHQALEPPGRAAAGAAEKWSAVASWVDRARPTRGPRSTGPGRTCCSTSSTTSSRAPHRAGLRRRARPARRGVGDRHPGAQRRHPVAEQPDPHRQPSPGRRRSSCSTPTPGPCGRPSRPSSAASRRPTACWTRTGSACRSRQPSRTRPCRRGAAGWRSTSTCRALGYRTYRVVPDTGRVTEDGVRATPTSLENEHLRLELDPKTGRITHLRLRDDGRDVRGIDLADPTRPRAVVVDDTSDTWGHRRITYQDVVGEFEATGITLVESGPARAILRVESRFGAVGAGGGLRALGGRPGGRGAGPPRLARARKDAQAALPDPTGGARRDVRHPVRDDRARRPTATRSPASAGWT